MNRFWAILNLIQLEHIPNAFSVWNELYELSLTWKKLVSSDVALLFDKVLGILSVYILLSCLNFTNFCHFLGEKSLCLLNVAIVICSALFQKGTSYNCYILFWDNTHSFTESWQEGNTVLLHSKIWGKECKIAKNWLK